MMIIIIIVIMSKLIYEPREPWWNDIDRGKLLIRPLEISENPTTRVI
jgi:hypothetical protein